MADRFTAEQIFGEAQPETGRYSAEQIFGEPKRKKWEAMWDAARIGFKDTIRGVQQIAGVNEEALAEEQRYLESLMQDPEYGSWAKAAYFGGLIADPVGWMLPVAKLKTASKISELIIPGMISGGTAGALGYAPEEGDRLKQAAMGATLGGAIGPAAFGLKKAYEPVGEFAWNVMRTPEGSGGIAGAGFGLYNTDENATLQEKMKNTFLGALIGGGAGRGFKLADRNLLDGKLARGLIPDYKLADAWINARSKAKGEKQVISGEFDKLVKEMSELPLESRRVLYGMLTDPTAPRDKMLEGLAKSSRDLINKYGEKLVDLQVLRRETFEEGKDTYIHRMYNDPDNVIGDAQGGIRIAGDELMMRGNVKTVNQSQWDAGYRPEGEGWEVVKTETFKNNPDPVVTIRRDWTPEERVQMDEVTDAMLAFDRTGKILANDVTAIKFFNDMADPDLGISATKATGDLKMEVPKVREYGKLGGKYVSQETYRDLMSIREQNLLASYKKNFEGYRKLNRMWKGTKTIANPAVHFNNITSNIIHFDFANGKASDVPKAFMDIRKGSDDFKDAQARGVFGGFFASEVAQEALPLEKLYSYKPGIINNVKLAENALGNVARFSSAVKKYTWDEAAKLYNFEDQLFRMALYRTERDRLMKLLPEEEAKDMAARKAREWFVDYERRTPLLEILREGPLPFASYMYGVIPKLAETAAKKPIKFAKWGLFFGGLNELGNPDERQERLLDAPNMFGIPGMPSSMVKLPEAVSPESKDDWYLNIARSLPGGDLFGVEKQGQLGQVPRLPEFMQPSFGAAGAVYDTLTGIDRFRGREITGGLGGRAEFLGRQFIPNFPIGGPGFSLPTWSGEKIERAFSGKYSPTRDVYTPGAAIASGLGLKVTPVSTRKLRKRKSIEFSKRERELKSIRRGIINDFKSGQITKQERDDALVEYLNDMKKLKREKARAFR